MTIAKINHFETLRTSAKFLQWKPEHSRLPDGGPLRPEDLNPAFSAAEKHFSVSEIAQLWGVSVDLIRDIFRKESGVLSLDRTGREKYITMRVPESVMQRVHRKLSQG